MDLAIKDVQRHLGKFIATIVGVGLLFAIVLIMNGIFAGNTADGVWLIENTDTDLWVVERDRGGPFNEQSRLPEDAYKSVAATPGVAQASPFITYGVQREVRGKEQQYTLIGYDVFGGPGGPGRIVEGRRIERAHYEMVADKKLGVTLGERLRLGVHEYTVVGLTKGAVDSGGNPLVYLSLPDAQEVLYQQDNRALEAARAASLNRLEAAGNTPEQAQRLLPLVSSSSDTINAILVRLRPGADPAQVAGHIRDWHYFNVYTGAEERELMLAGKLKKMSAILGLFRILLIAVSIIIIALLIYVLTMEKIKAIATLKLMGATNWVIVRLILEQSLVLTVAAFGCAYVLVELTYEHFPRTLVLLPSETLITFAVVFVGGLLASLLGIVQALRTPPSLALGADMSVLRVRGLGKVFGTGELAVTALDGVDLDVQAGELVALLGPSGSGKTTLLLCISLIIDPSAGLIEINGQAIYRDGRISIDVRRFRRENVGFIFQAHNLIPFLSALDNVALAMQLNGVDSGRARRRARELLDYLEIAHRADYMPANLSGGEQQRMAIGRALANEPPLIFADEPTASLDTERGMKVMDLLKRVAREKNSAIIAVTHDVRMIAGFDTLYHMDDGRLTHTEVGAVAAPSSAPIPTNNETLL